MAKKEIVITDVQALPDFTLLITFFGTEKRVLDLSEALEMISFAPLRNHYELLCAVFLDDEGQISWMLPEIDEIEYDRLLDVSSSYKVSLVKEYCYNNSVPYNE